MLCLDMNWWNRLSNSTSTSFNIMYYFNSFADRITGLQPNRIHSTHSWIHPIIPERINPKPPKTVKSYAANLSGSEGSESTPAITRVDIWWLAGWKKGDPRTSVILFRKLICPLNVISRIIAVVNIRPRVHVRFNDAGFRVGVMTALHFLWMLFLFPP